MEPTELDARPGRQWRRLSAAAVALALVIVAVAIGMNGGARKTTSLGNDDPNATIPPDQLATGGRDDSGDTSLSTGDGGMTTTTAASQLSDSPGRSFGDSATTTTAGRTSTTPSSHDVAAPAVDAVAYQLNAAHTGGHIDPDLPDELRVLWKRDLNASMSYPLIVGDRIFAVGAPYADDSAIQLYAFDRRTGAEAWPSVEIGGGRLSAPLIYNFTAGLAYDDGRIYVVNYDGVVRAFNPSTGGELWSTALPGIDATDDEGGVTSMPTAKNGRVYVVSPGKVFAIAGTDGRLVWTASVAGGGVKSAPAVSDDGVYVSVGAIDVYKFSLADGARLWHTHGGDQPVNGGTTPVLFGDRLYVRLGVPRFTNSTGLSFPGDARVLDRSTGAQLSSLRSVFTPAFRSGIGIFVDDARVATARDLATDEVLWSYPEDGTAPLVVNDDVFLQSVDGRLVRVALHSGEVLFASDPDLVDAWPNENAPQWMEHGLAEGRGVVAATFGFGLTVFG